MTYFKVVIILILLTLGACTAPNLPNNTKQELILDYDILSSLPEKNISYEKTIKPILGSRCVVCHSCYDAPCQLKLSSMEGLLRGASKTPVYNPKRRRHDKPTRLFIDAHSIQQWRQDGFYSVLNEAATANNSPNNLPAVLTTEKAENNLRHSVLYRMLNLKQLQPQPRIGKLDQRINLDLDVKLQCAAIEELNNFSKQHPGWGMPYGLPNLSAHEYKLLVQWLAQGSPAEKRKPLDDLINNQIKQWELFFNQPDKKQQLTSRYIYEHLFLGHIYFENSINKQNNKESQQQAPVFFRLVRSSTPSAQKIKEIATTRPYDSPFNINRPTAFYYRLKQDVSQTVVKNHNIYSFSQQKLQRFKELFIKPSYEVKQLPSYKPEIASNPLLVFKDIPPVSRYKFLLDNAHFFIESFIKGPVCRGQISLNVIEDYFWMVFINPDKKVPTLDPEFLNQNLNYFQLPAGKEDTLNVLSIWTEYWKNQKKYIQAKVEQFKYFQSLPIEQAIKYIYHGEGKNPNAALTIFRHLDSASVSYGLVGNGLQQAPETMVVIDYPIFERIFYLLVAGFDVYGNVGHQLNTRLYMEFLRMEGEDNFLAFLPVSSRKKIRDSWYKGLRENIAANFKVPMDWLAVQTVTGYKTSQPKLELYQKLKEHFRNTEDLALQKNIGFTVDIEKQLALIKNTPSTFNKESSTFNKESSTFNKESSTFKNKRQQKLKQLMDSINSLTGEKLQLIPDVTFLRIKMQESANDLAFTIINNKAYKHLHSMFENEKKSEQRDYQYDTLTMLNWLEGSYPNFFLDVNIEELDKFTQQFKQINSKEDYEKFVTLYGIRRTHTKFWELSDWFYQYYKKSQPVRSGYFDLNRYENR
ncbi:MAG: fatty acid cis/trans isomerase [Pseudomonadota bacterium]